MKLSFLIMIISSFLHFLHVYSCGGSHRLQLRKKDVMDFKIKCFSMKSWTFYRSIQLTQGRAYAQLCVAQQLTKGTIIKPYWEALMYFPEFLSFD